MYTYMYIAKMSSSVLQFSKNIDGFRQKDLQGFRIVKFINP